SPRETPPAALALDGDELRPNKVEAAGAGIAAIEAVDQPSPRFARAPAKLIGLRARRKDRGQSHLPYLASQIGLRSQRAMLQAVSPERGNRATAPFGPAAWI